MLQDPTPKTKPSLISLSTHCQLTASVQMGVNEMNANVPMSLTVGGFMKKEPSSWGRKQDCWQTHLLASTPSTLGSHQLLLYHQLLCSAGGGKNLLLLNCRKQPELHLLLHYFKSRTRVFFENGFIDGWIDFVKLTFHFCFK